MDPLSLLVAEQPCVVVRPAKSEELIRVGATQLLWAVVRQTSARRPGAANWHWCSVAEAS